MRMVGVTAAAKTRNTVSGVMYVRTHTVVRAHTQVCAHTHTTHVGCAAAGAAHDGTDEGATLYLGVGTAC